MNSSPPSPFSQLAETPVPGARVLDALRRELAEDAAPKRSKSREWRTLLSGGALFFGLGLSSLRSLRESPSTFFLSAVAFCLTVSGLLLLGVAPGERRLLGVSNRRALVVGVAGALFLALALQGDDFLPMSAFLDADHHTRLGACFAHSLLGGTLGSVALLLLWRRTDPFTPGLTGALLGLFGGLVGTLSVGLLCSNHEGFHLTLGHGMGAVLFLGVGLFLGRKWLAP